ncbi:M48 family metallopeptidase [Paraglaciecola sp. L3A3]|uniref:tetratricopeptide repeat protein n=1 Tax=Paraglaciecola sp. L3A3 TaxID=2686358 RepID=UPI00131D5194|nr:tetratricopeptide repeat protein [Paraglaciecola sp. L3A3]
MSYFNSLSIAILSLGILLSACGSTTVTKNIEVVANNNNSQQNVTPPSAEAILLARPNQYRATEPSMPPTMERQVKLALETIEQQQYPQALDLIANYVQADTKHSAIWVVKGDIAAAQKQDSQVIIGYYNQAVAINPNNYLAHNRLAILFTKQGEFDQALNHYQQAIDSWPGFAPAYLNRGILLDIYMGKKQQALDSYQTYQSIITLTQGKEAKKVRGWIVDLTRQLKQQG